MRLSETLGPCSAKTDCFISLLLRGRWHGEAVTEGVKRKNLLLRKNHRNHLQHRQGLTLFARLKKHKLLKFDETVLCGTGDPSPTVVA